MEQEPTEMIMIERYYIDEIVRRDENLLKCKELLLNMSINQQITRKEFYLLVRCIESSSSAVKELKNRIKEIEEKEVKEILEQA